MKMSFENQDKVKTYSNIQKLKDLTDPHCKKCKKNLFTQEENDAKWKYASAQKNKEHQKWQQFSTCGLGTLG